MPKVFLTEREKDLARLRENLRILECGRSSREMSSILGMSKTTYNERRRSPESFTYLEIYKLCKSANIDIKDFCGGRLTVKGE